MTICHVLNIYLLFVSELRLHNIRDPRHRPIREYFLHCCYFLSLTLKLTMETLLYSIYCFSNQSSSTCPELCCSCCHQNPKFHHITPIAKSLHSLKIWRRESNTRFSLLHINLWKLVNHLTSTLFVHTLNIVLLGLLFLSPLLVLLSPLVLKCKQICSCFVEQSQSDLLYVAHRVIPSSTYLCSTESLLGRIV